jgi:hypothetical protein
MLPDARTDEQTAQRLMGVLGEMMDAAAPAEANTAAGAPQEAAPAAATESPYQRYLKRQGAR